MEETQTCVLDEPADLHLPQAEDVDPSLLPPVDQLRTGGLH